MARSRCRGDRLSTHEAIPGILRHVHRLTRSFVHKGQRISYIHVYARPLGPGPEPELEFITAQERGFEGKAGLDGIVEDTGIAQMRQEVRTGLAHLKGDSGIDEVRRELGRLR